MADILIRLPNNWILIGTYSNKALKTSQLGKNGQTYRTAHPAALILTWPRTADKSEGNKTVGVDPTVITASMNICIVLRIKC